ncbi:MAG: hypothetical protein JJ975_11855 [Bacteroidia bacterium]|nr:hypothetical protein [Bacteroidia bacterium]
MPFEDIVTNNSINAEMRRKYDGFLGILSVNLQIFGLNQKTPAALTPFCRYNRNRPNILLVHGVYRAKDNRAIAMESQAH